MNRALLYLLGWLSLGLLGMVDRVYAQAVVPDSSLGTIVTPNNGNFTITGGTIGGTNLFHSFREFSVPTGGSARFNNAPEIQNIFSRVTGGTVSNIDGIIQANGAANLFLLNPNGILFGSGARLNIGGSFIGTTANRIQFENGAAFISTESPLPAPLLTQSAPIGLQMGQTPGAIQVQNTGHSLSPLLPSQFAPYRSTISTPGLQVQPQKTLALVGGDILLNGGILAAPGGRIELGSIGAGQVGLIPTPQGFTLDYTGASRFQTVQLNQRSLINTGGLLAGSIQVQGDRITLQEGSLLWNQNLGSQPGGGITVRATDRLELIGMNASEQVRS
ncbi:filamentous hemagglutinin N-terminal domain-containing protein, partial [Pseudanabaenaceae cyanobacterium LEGE 13415]|nr:filamentous hemagglutinin N-terminal domain-containing protein [Pseudanabaenaceae cyanobacterium LEGE 13415]